MDEILSTQEMVVLLGARDGLTYEEMGASMSRSKAWIQVLIKQLKDDGYLEHERYKHRSLALTKKAIHYLRAQGVSYERQPNIIG